MIQKHGGRHVGGPPCRAVCRPRAPPSPRHQAVLDRLHEATAGRGRGRPLHFATQNRGSAFFFLRNPSPSANRSPLLWRLAFVLPRSHPHKHASHQRNPTRAGWGGRGREHGARGRQCFFIIPPGSAGAVPPHWRAPAETAVGSRKSSPLERLGKVSRKGLALVGGPRKQPVNEKNNGDWFLFSAPVFFFPHARSVESKNRGRGCVSRKKQAK